MKHPPFDFDEPEESPGFLLWQTTMTWQRLIKKALEPYGISHAQFVIMAILLWWKKIKKDPAQVDIIGMSRLDKMTVSKSITKLVSLGLIERAEHKKDSRAKVVHLTKSGAVLVSKLIPIIEGIDDCFFGQLRRKQEENLIGVLKTLITRIRD
ncbi:MAG: winged helix-turn-helix transcriptional regulator [Chlamydiia bacterium]|nr:winged helix-turn-helix transcriptional regulator [Chlamydiia bacterium]